MQKHCHHDHVMALRRRRRVLQKLGLDFEVLELGLLRDGGLVRLRGGALRRFGRRSASASLLPAVRAADADTLIIADGFSCREQIADLTGRGALHLAQVIQMAMREGPNGPARRPPRVRVPAAWQVGTRTGSLAATAAVAGAGTLLGLGLAYALTRLRRPLA